MADINDRIRARIDAFVEELSDLVQRATLEAVNDALRTELRGAGRRGALAEGRRGGRRRGQKRSQEEIGQSAERAFKFIESNPGVGIEQIGKEIGESTADLTLPLKKLLGEKRIAKKGQKRGTRYFPKAR